MSCDLQYFTVQLEKLCIKAINTSMRCVTSASASVTTESWDLDSLLLSLTEEKPKK